MIKLTERMPTGVTSVIGSIPNLDISILDGQNLSQDDQGTLMSLLIKPERPFIHNLEDIVEKSIPQCSNKLFLIRCDQSLSAAVIYEIFRQMCWNLDDNCLIHIRLSILFYTQVIKQLLTQVKYTII